MAKAKNFYIDILGFQQLSSTDGWVELSVPGLSTVFFALNQWPLDSPAPQNNFVTLGVGNLAEFRKYLSEKNVKLKGETEFHEEGIKLLKFFDPDGNTITAAEVV